MATNENLIPIPGRLHSVASEGHVAGADEIYDDTQGKLQSAINTEVAGKYTKPSEGIPVSDLAGVGSANGLASLDSSGKVPSTQLPSYVDDVIEGYYYNSKFYEEAAHTTEITPEDGKIYIDLTGNLTYRWGGSAYVEISQSLALGETASTAFAGNRGVAIEGKIPSAASSSNKLVDSASMQSALSGKANTSDVNTALAGKANVSDVYTKTQIDNQYYTVAEGEQLESDVQSAISAQNADIANYIALYNGSEVIVTSDHMQEANPNTQKIYREYGSNSYTDWMCTNTSPVTWQALATYSMPGIDNEPTAGSHNLVESGGVASALHEIDKEINGGSDTYEGDITTGSETYVRPQIHYTDVNIPAGIYTVGIDLNGTFSGSVLAYLYDSNGDQITGITDKNGTSISYISSDSIPNYNPFTIPANVKRIGLYGDNKLTDGTISVSFETPSQEGLVQKVEELEGEIDNKADVSEVEEIESVVYGNSKSNRCTVSFLGGVPINAAGSLYRTTLKIAVGTYRINTQRPSALNNLMIYFYDKNGNAVKPTDNTGEEYNSMGIPPYDSRQPFTFSEEVDYVEFYSIDPSPSADCVLTFEVIDTEGDKNVRELVEDVNVVPDVVLPRKLYLLSSNSDTIENSIYHKHYMSFQNPRFGIDVARGYGWRCSPRFLRTNANGTIQSPIISMYDIPNRKLLNTFNPTVVTGIKETNNGAKVVNIIGDSFTQDGTWFNEINSLCSNLSFVGMRQPIGSTMAEGVKAEGRGGWRLSTYFEPHEDVTPSHMQPFSPFMHVSGYTYYGVIDFWKAIVNDNSQYEYGTEGFDDYKSWFDSDGYKVNPPTNALMYDGVNDKYVYYNGSAWVDFSGTPTFEFDYSKYISTWNISSPDFVMIQLGTNDFGGNSEVSNADWSVWKNRMDTLITSVKAYGTSVSKNIIIAICTPTVRYGAENGSYGVNQDIYSIGTFDGRKRIIEAYDNSTAESDNVFVVDTGVAVDTEYGWWEWNTEENELPFAQYTGTFREFYGYNDPHPSVGGYKQIGVVGAAFIQAKRA